MRIVFAYVIKVVENAVVNKYVITAIMRPVKPRQMP